MDTYDDVKRRTLRYWYVDGLVEIMVGFVFFLLALLMVFAAVLSPSPVVKWLLGVGQPVLILSGMWAGGRAVRYFKERITYPRTGYVEYKRVKPRRRWGKAVLGLIIGFSVAVLAAGFASRISDTWLPMMMVVPIALFVVYLAIYFGLIRFYPAAAAIFLSGFLPILLGIHDSLATALILAAVALVWWVSGGLALRSYLRHTTAPSGEQPS